MSKSNEQSQPTWVEQPQPGVARTLTLLRSRDTYCFAINGISWMRLGQVEERDHLALGFVDARVDIFGRGLNKLWDELASGQHVFVRAQGETGENTGDEKTWIQDIKVGARSEIDT